MTSLPGGQVLPGWASAGSLGGVHAALSFVGAMQHTNIWPPQAFAQMSGPHAARSIWLVLRLHSLLLGFLLSLFFCFAWVESNGPAIEMTLHPRSRDFFSL